jgi:hypothetical protein
MLSKTEQVLSRLCRFDLPRVPQCFFSLSEACLTGLTSRSFSIGKLWTCHEKDDRSIANEWRKLREAFRTLTGNYPVVQDKIGDSCEQIMRV